MTAKMTPEDWTIEIRERTDELVFAVRGFRRIDEMQSMAQMLTALPDLIAALREIIETAAALELGNARRPLSQIGRSRLAKQIDAARAALRKAGIE